MKSEEFISNKVKIFEGGNVVITTNKGKQIPAQKVDLTEVDRTKFTTEMKKAFMYIDSLFNKMYGRPLWPDKAVFNNGHVFNGSSEAMFNSSISNEKYVSVKPSVGDIDITVPDDSKEELWNLLKKITGKKVSSSVQYLGDNRPSYSEGNSQINSIFKYNYAPQKIVNVQVDFEFLPYDKKGAPTEFSKFGHSSNWTDLNSGLKGVHHKYILRALAGGSSMRNDIVIMTNTASPLKPRPKKMDDNPTMLAFFIGKGIRVKYKQQFLPDGKPWMYNGKKVFKEISTNDSNYESNLTSIFKILFGEPKSTQEVKKLWSFSGILELMKQYHNPQQNKNTLSRLVELYWGRNAQGLERDNPALDNKVKSAGWNKAVQVFPNAKQFNVDAMKKIYYNRYKMSKDMS